MTKPFTGPDFVRFARERVCPPTAVHVDPERWPYGDHGHTDCFIIGGLLAYIETLQSSRDLAVGVIEALREESWGFWWLRDEGRTPVLTVDSTVGLDPEQYTFLQTLTEDPT